MDTVLAFSAAVLILGIARKGRVKKLSEGWIPVERTTKRVQHGDRTFFVLDLGNGERWHVFVNGLYFFPEEFAEPTALEFKKGRCCGIKIPRLKWANSIPEPLILAAKKVY